MGRADDVTATTTHQLYERYGRQIYAYCLHQLRSREEAEDAVQTTFLNAFRSLKGGAVTHAEQAWLYKIAQNVCSARRSSAARRLRLETPNDFDVLQETIPAQSRESAVELIGLEDALEAMPENQRRAILLREWQGLSYREIGEELDLSQASVEMLIFRARRNLAGALEQPAEEKKLKRKVGRTLNLGSLLAAVKSLLTGGAAVKAVALAVAAGTVSVTASAVQHTILRSRPHAPVHTATTLSVAPPATRSLTPRSKAPFVVERSISPTANVQHAIATPRFVLVGGKARLSIDDVVNAPVVPPAPPPVQAPAPVQPQPQSTQESSPPPPAPRQQDAPSQSTSAPNSPSSPAPPAKKQDGPPQSTSATAAPSAPAPSAEKKRKSQDNVGNSTDSQPTVTTTVATTTTPTPAATPPDDHGNGKQKKNQDQPVVTTQTTTATVTTTTTDDHGNGKPKKNEAPPQMAPLPAPATSTTTPVTPTAPVTTAPAPQAPADDHGNGGQRKNQDQQPQQPVVTTAAPATTTPAQQPPADDHGNGGQRKNQDQQPQQPVVTAPAVVAAPPAPGDSGNGHDQGHGHGHGK